MGIEHFTITEENKEAEEKVFWRDVFFHEFSSEHKMKWENGGNEYFPNG